MNIENEPEYSIKELYDMIARGPNSNENQVATMYVDWGYNLGHPEPKCIQIELPCGCVSTIDVTDEDTNIFDEMVGVVVSLNVTLNDEELVMTRFLRIDDSVKLFVLACIYCNEEILPDGALEMNPFELVGKIVENK